MNVKAIAVEKSEVEQRSVTHKFMSWKEDFQFKGIFRDLKEVNSQRV
jgi:hypothetical protein